jgi:hypothetical protein
MVIIGADFRVGRILKKHTDQAGSYLWSPPATNLAD